MTSIWHTVVALAILIGIAATFLLLVDLVWSWRQSAAPPEWRLTEDERRKKELRLVVGRDARGGR